MSTIRLRCDKKGVPTIPKPVTFAHAKDTRSTISKLGCGGKFFQGNPTSGNFRQHQSAVLGNQKTAVLTAPTGATLQSPTLQPLKPE